MEYLINYGKGFLFLSKRSQEAHSWFYVTIEIVCSGAKRRVRMFKLFHARSLVYL